MRVPMASRKLRIIQYTDIVANHPDDGYSERQNVTNSPMPLVDLSGGHPRYEGASLSRMFSLMQEDLSDMRASPEVAIMLSWMIGSLADRVL